VNIGELDQLNSERGRTRIGGPLRDAVGDESHFVMIEGPTELVRTVFADSEFDIAIEPGEGREDWERRFRETLHSRSEPISAPADALEGGLFKPSSEMPTADNSMVMVLQRTQPSGTSYLLAVPFAMPRGISLFFVLPPVCSAAGISLPTAGDPDLFLMLTPSGPTVAASTLLGLASDRVAFSLPICLPLIGFVPFFRVFGFLPSTGVLLFGGFAFP
jgi:hypothetical protein